MVIVAGHISVDPGQRESYLAGCVRVVEQARGTAGCLAFTITADLIDPGRVNIFERWESQAALEAFRGSGPDTEQRPGARASRGRERHGRGLRRPRRRRAREGKLLRAGFGA